MGQHLLEVNMEHLKDHADYKYNKSRKINTKYSVIGKTKVPSIDDSVTVRSWIVRSISLNNRWGNLYRIHHADEKKRHFNENN
tara:strand:- start:2559 stop:2807 length:249 start_codon:yes stop_codon:yes gene_type:complete